MPARQLTAPPGRGTAVGPRGGAIPPPVLLREDRLTTSADPLQSRHGLRVDAAEADRVPRPGREVSPDIAPAAACFVLPTTTVLVQTMSSVPSCAAGSQPSRRSSSVSTLNWPSSMSMAGVGTKTPATLPIAAWHLGRARRMGKQVAPMHPRCLPTSSTPGSGKRPRHCGIPGTTGTPSRRPRQRSTITPKPSSAAGTSPTTPSCRSFQRQPTAAGEAAPALPGDSSNQTVQSRQRGALQYASDVSSLSATQPPTNKVNGTSRPLSNVSPPSASSPAGSMAGARYLAMNSHSHTSSGPGLPNLST